MKTQEDLQFIKRLSKGWGRNESECVTRENGLPAHRSVFDTASLLSNIKSRQLDSSANGTIRLLSALRSAASESFSFT